MAVAFLNSPGAANCFNLGGANSPLSYTSAVQNNNTSVDINSGATACFVTVWFSGSTTCNIQTISWSGGGGQALTKITTLAGATSEVELWGIVNPTPATGGTFTITWTGPNARTIVFHSTWTGTVTTSVAAAFTNVTTTNTGTAAAPSVSVTGTTGDICVGFFGDDSNQSNNATANQNTLFINGAGGGGGRACAENYVNAATGSNTLSGTLISVNSISADVVGFNIVADSGGGGGTQPFVIIGLASAEW